MGPSSPMRLLARIGEPLAPVGRDRLAESHEGTAAPEEPETAAVGGISPCGWSEVTGAFSMIDFLSTNRWFRCRTVTPRGGS